MLVRGMKSYTPLLSVVLLGWFALVSCDKKTPAASGPAGEPPASAVPAFLKDIDAAEAGRLVAEKAPPQVLDVRTPEEFAAGHIGGAINLDFNSPGFKEEVAKLERGATYLLHCRSGSRSGKAKPTFEELGFKAIYHLEGGINAWEAAGLPTVKEE